MTSTNIFMAQTDEKIKGDISGKITLTNIIDVIPKNYTTIPIKGWKSSKNTEWCWRILEFNDRKVVEISYMKNDSDKRTYFNRFGEWVERTIDQVYDKFVTATYYYYT